MCTLHAIKHYIRYHKSPKYVLFFFSTSNFYICQQNGNENAIIRLQFFFKLPNVDVVNNNADKGSRYLCQEVFKTPFQDISGSALLFKTQT